MHLRAVVLLICSSLLVVPALADAQKGRGPLVTPTVTPQPLTRSGPVTVTFRAPTNRPKGARWIAHFTRRYDTTGASNRCPDGTAQSAERTVLGPAKRGRKVSITLRLVDSRNTGSTAWCAGTWQLSIGTQTPALKREHGWSAFRLKPQHPKAGLSWDIFWLFDVPGVEPMDPTEASTLAHVAVAGVVPTLDDLHDAIDPHSAKGFPGASHYLRAGRRVQVRFTFLDSSVVRWTQQTTSAKSCQSKAKWRTVGNGVAYLRNRYVYFYPSGKEPFLRVKRGRWQLASVSGAWRTVRMTAGQWDADDPLTNC